MFSNVPNTSELLEGLQSSIEGEEYPKLPDQGALGNTAINVLNKAIGNIPGMSPIPNTPSVPPTKPLPVGLPKLPPLPKAGQLLKVPFL